MTPTVESPLQTQKYDQKKRRGSLPPSTGDEKIIISLQRPRPHIIAISGIKQVSFPPLSCQQMQ